MPDELPVPEDGAPQQDSQPEVDWQKRYTDTHAEYTRLNQQLQRYETDRDALAELVAKHGYELPEDEEDEPEEEYEEEQEPQIPPEVAKQLEDMQTWREEVEAQRTVQAFNQHVDQLASEKDVQVNDKQREFIFSQALAKGLSEETVQAAFTDLFGLFGEVSQQAVEQSRKRPRVPTPPPASGTAATEVPNLDDRQARVRHMTQRYNDLSYG